MQYQRRIATIGDAGFGLRGRGERSEIGADADARFTIMATSNDSGYVGG